MSTVSLGRVSIVPRGEYDPTATYERMDAVTYRGSSYLALRTVRGVEPSPGDDYMLLAASGSGGVPAVSASDNGKFLRVVDGAWVATAVPSAEEEKF